MTRVVVATSSAVVRSVLKGIILKTTKIKCVGDVAAYDSLKSTVTDLKPDVIITDRLFFDTVSDKVLSEYADEADIPIIVYYMPGNRPQFSIRNVKFVEQPEFMNFSSRKEDEYSAFLEQLILDLKCSSLLSKHISALLPYAEIKYSHNYDMQPVPSEFTGRNFKAVLVGVSTGGPSALLELLKGIDKNFPLPIFITQHIDSFFDKNLITWLNGEASVPVQLASNDIKPLPGHVYFAPSDAHLTFVAYSETEYHVVLDYGLPVNFLRPAVDKMFESGAKVFGKNCIAVVLTGMGTDGARQCVKLKNLGAYTIAQDESSSTIYGMPKAALEMGGVCEVLPLGSIASRLRSLVGEGIK